MPTGLQGVDWGNVPTWVSAVVTSTSASIAAVSYRRSVRDKERSQASLVGAWISVEDKDAAQERVIRISNASDAPVYDVSIRIPGMREERLGELPPKTTTTLEARAPSSNKTSRATSAAVSLFLVQASVTRETRTEDPPPELEFRDGSGKLWHRSPDGKLRQMRERTFTSVRASVKAPFMELTSESEPRKSR